MNQLAAPTSKFLSQRQEDLICDSMMGDPRYTDIMKEMFLTTVERTRLDPFAKQIWPQIRKDNVNNVENLSITITADGMRAVAERTGEYEGQTPVQWCDKDGVWKDVWLGESLPPYAARVGVYRKGFREPLYAVARYAAYMATGPLWKKMGDTMIAKCAEVLALRRAFPNQLAGVYAEEEMQQADNAGTATPAGDTGFPQPVVKAEVPAATTAPTAPANAEAVVGPVVATVEKATEPQPPADPIAPVAKPPTQTAAPQGIAPPDQQAPPPKVEEPAQAQPAAPQSTQATKPSGFTVELPPGPLKVFRAQLEKAGISEERLLSAIGKNVRTENVNEAFAMIKQLRG